MKTLVAALILSLSTCAFSLVAFGADGKVIPRKDLPAQLRGGKEAKASKFPGIPSCTVGRVETKVADLGDWAETHAKHACVDAGTVLACHVAGRLSVRCE